VSQRKSQRRSIREWASLKCANEALKKSRAALMKNRKEFSARPLMRKTKWRRAGFLSRSHAHYRAKTNTRRSHGLLGPKSFTSPVHTHTHNITHMLTDLSPPQPHGVCIIFTSLALNACIIFLSAAGCIPRRRSVFTQGSVYVPGRKRRRAAQRAPLWLQIVRCDPVHSESCRNFSNKSRH
jgi:hypothetical protein